MAAYFQGGQDDHRLRPQQFTFPKARNSTTSTEGCHQTGRIVRMARWVLLYILHNSKERQGCKAHTRLLQPKQVPEDLTISIVAHNRCSPGGQAAALVHHSRLKGCLLPYSNCSIIQAITTLCISGPGLSVLCPLIHPFSIPTSLHQVHGGDPGSNPSQRTTSASVLG